MMSEWEKLYREEQVINMSLARTNLKLLNERKELQKRIVLLESRLEYMNSETYALLKQAEEPKQIELSNVPALELPPACIDYSMQPPALSPMWEGYRAPEPSPATVSPMTNSPKSVANVTPPPNTPTIRPPSPLL